MRKLVLLAALCGWIGLVDGARAQDPPRSDTGRHRPEPPPAEQRDEAVAAVPTTARGDWCLTFGFGMAGGSDLFNARTVSGNPVTWPGAPFPTADFNAKLDNGYALAAGVGRRVGPWWTLRAELGWSELDVGAESAVGQVGEIFTYDSYRFWQLALGAELRLVRQPSAPYVGLAVLLQGLGASQADEVNQTSLGGRLSFGYQHTLNETSSLRLEGRLVHAASDLEDQTPVTSPPVDVVFDGQDSLTIWQLMLGVQMEI